MIIAAAIKDSDGKIWTLPKPARHGNIILEIVKAKVAMANHIQGFVTNDGTFLNRKEARQHAIDCKQPFYCYNPKDSSQRFVDNNPQANGELFSEDLW
jgi:hypothetical protein